MTVDTDALDVEAEEYEPHHVIQGMCVDFRCDDIGASFHGGVCTCPCHDLATPAEVAHFARGLRGEPNDQCRYCERLLRARYGYRLPRHNHPTIGRRCMGSGSTPARLAP